MSYSIFYRAMFIRLSDGTFIPIIESGDNNVWEADNRRRSRDWEACRWLFESDEQRRRISLSADEILAAAQYEVDKIIHDYAGKEPPFGGEPYTREKVLKEFSYFSCIHVTGHSSTSASMFLNFIKSGFRNAASADELYSHHSWICFGWWDDNGYYHSDEASDESEILTKWNQYLSEGITPYVSLSGGTEGLWETVRKRSVKPRTKRDASTESFVIAFNYGNGKQYLVKLSSRNMRFYYNRDLAHRYTSRKVAENTVQSIVRRFSNVSDVHVESMLPALVPAS